MDQSSMKAPDLLRRFTPTPLTTDLCLMGRAVRLETNSAAILEQARRAFAGYGQPATGVAQFLWRLVDESSDPSRAPHRATVIADQGLLLVNLDERGFVAADTNEREAVGFLDSRWGGILFPALLWVVTASAFGLTMVSAPCLARGNRALLILGPQESAESLLDEAVRRLGVHIHARRTAFVEAGRSGPQVWGEFWSQAGSFEQHAREGPRGAAFRAANLAGCIWIDRQRSLANPKPLVGFDGAAPEFESAPGFSVTASSALEDTSLRERLRQLPQYHLDSGADPSQAIPFVEQVLGRRNALEALS